MDTSKAVQSRKRSRLEDGSYLGAEINDVYHSREFLERITSAWRYVKLMLHMLFEVNAPTIAACLNCINKPRKYSIPADTRKH